MNNITQARYNFVLAFQFCWNGEDFPTFRNVNIGEQENIHSGYLAILLLDEALHLKSDFQEACDLRSEIWHAILTNPSKDDQCYAYERYLKSKAWFKKREALFNKVGRLCICGNQATEVHHRTYDNIGKENLLTDLTVLCKRCHEGVHQFGNPNQTMIKPLEDILSDNQNPIFKVPDDIEDRIRSLLNCQQGDEGELEDVEKNNPGKDYWDKFKAYVEGNKSPLKLFDSPDLPSYYGIQIEPETKTSVDRYKSGAFWLIAFRNINKLRACIYMRSEDDYRKLEEKKKKIEDCFEDNIDKLEWDDHSNQMYKAIGFSKSGEVDVKDVKDVPDTDLNEEFSWLHERLIKLQKVFEPIVQELKKEADDTNR